jgi:hypothetical protein
LTGAPTPATQESVETSRRPAEPATKRRTVQRSAPDLSASPASRLLRLQKSAGNRAVSGLLDVQRDPDPAPTPAPALVDQLAEARALITKGDIDAPAFDYYRASTAGTVADVITSLWQNDLYLIDVDPAGAGLDRKQTKALTDFKAFLRARVDKVVNAKLAELTKQVPTSATKIGEQVDAILKESPMWGEGAVTDRLYVEWVGPGPIGDRSPSGAKALWAALRVTGGASVASKRGSQLSKASVKALDATELGAVKTLLDPSTTWVVTPEETAALTDRAAAALGHPTNRADPAWKDLRDKMPTLILAAEADIINATIPQSKKLPLVPASWANFRNRYIATLTKPMWTFYRDNIVDAEILGEKVKASTDSSGLHRDVAAVIPLVEQSAMRLGGFASKADLIKANQRPGSEFRFESMSHPEWMGKARHLSFHGTGRAMDFRAGANPDFGGPTHQLVSILGGGELSELSAGSTAQRQDLQKVATHNADAVRLRTELQKKLAASTDDAEKSQLQGDIDRIDAHLRDEVLTDATTIKVRERASDTHQTVKSIETNFIAAWAKISLMRNFPLGEEIAADLLGQTVDAAARTAQDAYDAAKAAQDAIAAAQKAKTPVDPALRAKAADLGVLESRIRRIKEVQTLLASPTAKVSDTTQKGMLDKVEKLSQSGLTDMPSWMVQAFAERGWQWGMWSGFADAMHFDYMGPIADVRSEAQYL